MCRFSHRYWQWESLLICEELKQATHEFEQTSMPISFVTTGGDVSSKNLDQLDLSFRVTWIWSQGFFVPDFRPGPNFRWFFGPGRKLDMNFGPGRTSGAFSAQPESSTWLSARAQSHLMNHYKKILSISIVVGTLRSAEQDDVVLSRTT